MQARIFWVLLRMAKKYRLSKVLMLMITTSDNTASLWSQSLAGTGTAINTLMEKNGLKSYPRKF